MSFANAARPQSNPRPCSARLAGLKRLNLRQAGVQVEGRGRGNHNTTPRLGASTVLITYPWLAGCRLLSFCSPVCGQRGLYSSHRCRGSHQHQAIHASIANCRARGKILRRSKLYDCVKHSKIQLGELRYDSSAIALHITRQKWTDCLAPSAGCGWSVRQKRASSCSSSCAKEASSNTLF